MARHRHIRKMRYEDELSADEYGISYDDLNHYAVSPDTEEMFTYNRNATKEHTLSSFIEEQSFNEEEQYASDEENGNLNDPSADYKMPTLGDADQAKLQSGLESLEGILGDNCHQPTAVDALMKFNYDVEKALDEILSKGGRQTLSLETQSNGRSKDSQKIFHRDFSSNNSNMPSGISCMPLENEKQRIVSSNDTAANLQHRTQTDGKSVMVVQQTRSIDKNTSVRGKLNDMVMKQPLNSLASIEAGKFNCLSNFMVKPSVSAKVATNSIGQSKSDNLMNQSLSSLASIEVANSNNLSGFTKPLLPSKVTTNSLVQSKSDNLMGQSLSSLASIQRADSNGLSDFMKPSLPSKVTTNSLGQSKSDNLMNQSLSSLASFEAAESNGLSAFMKPSLPSKVTTNSLGQSKSDNLMDQSLSSLASIQRADSNGLSRFMKSSLASKVAKNSLGQSKSDDVMDQSLSTLASIQREESNGLSGFMKPSLPSKMTGNSSDQIKNDNLINQSLNSLASIEVADSNCLSGFINPSFPSKVTMNSLGQRKSDKVMNRSLSSLASIETTRLNGFSDVTKSPLTKKATTHKLGTNESETLMKQTLTSLASIGTIKSSNPFDFMKSPILLKMATNSMGQIENENLMKQSLSSLASSETTKSSGLYDSIKSPVTSTATTSSGHVCKSDMLTKPSDFLAESHPETLLSSPGVNKSLGHDTKITARDFHGIESNSLHSGGAFSTFLTRSRNPVYSDVAMRSSEKLASELGTTSLCELARDNEAFGTNAFCKLTDKGDESRILSGVNLPELDLVKNVTGASVDEVVSVQNSPLVERPGNDLTPECTNSTSVKNMRTSLKKLSLESALKRFPRRTNGAISLHSVNRRLPEDRPDLGSSINNPESIRMNFDNSLSIGSISSSAGIISDYEDTAMKNDSDPGLKNISTVTNRVRKRKASVFGQALSALHEPSVKIPRRDPLYDNANGFALPLTVDLRGMLHSDHTLSVFNFSTPSQDDVVRVKQSQAFSKKNR